MGYIKISQLKEGAKNIQHAQTNVFFNFFCFFAPDSKLHYCRHLRL